MWSWKGGCQHGGVVTAPGKRPVEGCEIGEKDGKLDEREELKSSVVLPVNATC